jgi:hypothetical protein
VEIAGVLTLSSLSIEGLVRKLGFSERRTADKGISNYGHVRDQLELLSDDLMAAFGT